MDVREKCDERNAVETLEGAIHEAVAECHSFRKVRWGDEAADSFRHYAFQENGLVEIESQRAARDRERPGEGRVFLRPR